MSAAIEIKKACFKGRTPITAYGEGGFRFGGVASKGALLCLPSGFYSIEGVENNLAIEHFSEVFEHSSEIEILLIGTGLEITKLDSKIISQLREKGIKAEVMTTGAAVRTYNVLLSEEREVGAVLLPV